VNDVARSAVIVRTMNATLHIEHVDESVMLSLRELALEEHVSIEEAARRVLKRLAAPVVKSGENGSRVPDKNEILRSQFGSWTQEEVEEFERNTAPFREIDPDLWK
jgi:hypothetical protein